MHLAPKEILINAHVKLRDRLTTEEIEKSIEEIEALIQRAEPKVQKIFIETARETEGKDRKQVPAHVG
jgi:divalent metal cation (Fe/Co/Zn/Cd) transporter